MTVVEAIASPYEASYSLVEFADTFGPIHPQEMVVRDGKAMLCRLFDGGYIFESDIGPYALLGAGLDDEMFSKPGLGMFNITKAIQIVKASPENFPVLRTDITPDMIEKSDDLITDENVINSMTVNRRNSPLIYMFDGDGHHILDGCHRLKRRIRDHKKFIKFHLFDAAEAAHIRIDLYRLTHGIWTRLDAL